ncbi:hypothetical protein DY000_02025532 [Brassica cretica]|uniref:Uncharacterized protein n=1 Tax=Brassica cretica TaxID=69181 RepID=A0ABQ7E515_BRACR|nr:hypothetical protein DY000_02025532 [Brassica cretica]
MAVSKNNKRKKKKNSTCKLPPGSMGWPYLGETLQLYSQDPNVFFTSKQKSYGDIFKTRILGYPCVMLASPEAARFVLVTHAHMFKPMYPRSKERLIGPSALFFHQGDYHAYLRKLVQSSLYPETIRKLIPDIEHIALSSLQSLANMHIVSTYQEMKKASVLPVYVSSGVGGVSSSSSPFSFALVTCLFSSPICEISVWRVSDDTCSLLRSSSCLSFPKVSFVVEKGLSAFLSVEAWCLVSVYGLAGAQGRWWSRTVGAFSVVCGEEIHSSACFPFARAPHGLDFTMVQPFRARRGCFLFPDSLLRLVLQRVLKSESQRFRSHRVPNLPPLQPIFVRWVWSVFVALAMAGSIHLPVGVARLGGCVGMLSHLSFHSG